MAGFIVFFSRYRLEARISMFLQQIIQLDAAAGAGVGCQKTYTYNHNNIGATLCYRGVEIKSNGIFACQMPVCSLSPAHLGILVFVYL